MGGLEGAGPVGVELGGVLRNGQAEPPSVQSSRVYKWAKIGAVWDWNDGVRAPVLVPSSSEPTGF